MANLNPGDQVCVIADCSRKGEVGVIQRVLPASIAGDPYQACIVVFKSGTGGVKEHYFVKELRPSRVNIRPIEVVS